MSLALAAVAQKIDAPRVLGYDKLIQEVSQSLHWVMPETTIAGPEDSIYIAPTADDIQELLKFYRWRREGMEYLSEGFDCDDFAREFKHWATVWATRYYSHTPAALAVGMVYVHIDGDVSDIFPPSHEIREGYHVLNAILREDGQWLFFEPQTGCLVPVESMLYEGSIEVLKINL